jgi:lipopolysaccharide export LptBFGC system permease protein LptF
MNSETLQIATDEECAARRNRLIKAGIITENSNKLMERSGEQFLSTTEYSSKLRKNLESRELISSDYVEVPRMAYYTGHNEEGEYKAKPIRSQAQYKRKLSLYFRMLQEILIARINLKLNLAPRQNSDPDWIF